MFKKAKGKVALVTMKWLAALGLALLVIGAPAVTLGDGMIESMTLHAGWVLFVWVLANQAGVPVPVAPFLLTAGALAGSGSLRFIMVLAVVVGATLCADLLWYSLGRWRGAQVLRALSRLFRLSNTSVDRAETLFLTHQLGFLLTARFLPELNPVAAGLAGLTRVRLTRYLLSAAGSALVWAGAWASAGYVLSGAVAGDPARFGIPFSVMIAGAIAAASLSGLILMRSQAFAESSPSLRDRRCGLHPRRFFCPRAGDPTLGSVDIQGS
jgi:membrane protein DedA with SNARE-associated domain